MSDAPEFVTLQVEDGIGTIRLDRPKMNAISEQLHMEVRAAAVAATERADVRAVVIYGGERVFAAGADIKQMSALDGEAMSVWGFELTRRSRRSPTSQAGHRRGHRLRAGRWVRAGALCRLPGGRGVGEDRPARDPARRHPRCRRQPAAGGLVGRAKARTSSSRVSGRQGGVEIGGRRVVPDDEVFATSVHGEEFVVGPSLALAAGGPSTRPRPDAEEGLALESRLFAGLFDTEDQKTGMRSFLESGPGKAEFSGR